MICAMVGKYLNEMHGPHDGSDASPATSPIVSPPTSPNPGVESSVAGATWNAESDGVDE